MKSTRLLSRCGLALVRAGLWVLLFTWLIAVTGQAATAPIAYEGFNYTSGALAGQAGGSGWTGLWSDDAVSPGGGLVLAGGLVEPGGQLTITGNRGALLSAVASKPTAYRYLASSLGVTGTTAWVSFLLRPDTLSEGWLMIGGPPESTAKGLLVGYKGTTIGMDHDGLGGSKWVSGIAPAQGVTMFLVVKLDFLAGDDTATLYVNPTPGLAAPDSIYSVIKSDLDLGAFTQLALRGKQSAQQSFDEIRVGTSYLAVAPDTDPALFTQPASLTVGAGQNATFSVTAGGTAPLWYQWFFNRVPLAAATNAALTLANVVVGQAGDYFVTLSNGVGMVTSDTATLTVLSGSVRHVSNTNDLGPGSLRQAILDANALPDTDTIAFGIPGPGPHVIPILSLLPVVQTPLVIDGYTQPGASTNSLPVGNNAVIQIRISGGGAVNSAFRFNVGGCTLRGLSLTDLAGDAVSLVGFADVRVEGNFIGLDPDGITVRGNGGAGVDCGAGGGTVGGALPWQRNVISGNRKAGIVMQNSYNNVVEGNYIGTDASGLLARGNLGPGISLLNVNAINNRIGGSAAGQGNVISGNGSGGLTNHGIYISNASSNQIQGNFIGTDVTGTRALGNLGCGIYMTNATVGNAVGGFAREAGNVIAYNTAAGVWLASGTNTVLRNSIFANGGLSIDLGASGVTANDAGDLDLGPNNLQNFPVLTAVTNKPSLSPDQLEVWGTLNSRPSTSYQIDFFVNTQTGSGGGTWQGARNLTTDASGNASFVVKLTTGSLLIRSVAATATDPFGNTSEFSAQRPAEWADPPIITVAPQDALVWGFGGTNSLAVEADGTATIYCQWFREGVPIPGQTNRTLWFNGVKPSDLGVYSVVVSNIYGAVGPLSAALRLAPDSGILLTDNLSDAGPGSLRQAILDANAATGQSTIFFNFTGSGPFTLTLTSPLPPLTQPTLVDGTTLPGYAGQPLVELDGGGLPGDGLVLTAGNSTVRGLAIGNFGGSGLRLEGGGTNRVEGNFIGLRADGVTPFPNQQHGVQVVASAGNHVGGTDAGRANVIAANQGDGLRLEGAEAADNVIQGNFIGTDATASRRLGNGGAGVVVAGAVNGLVGGTSSGEANWIAFNGGQGVLVLEGSCALLGNVIFENAGQAIDLAGDGPTPNDPGDFDSGANAQQNFPDIASAKYGLSGISLMGSLQSAPDTFYRLEFFAGPACGQALVFLGAADVVTDPFGDAAFAPTLPCGDLSGWFVMATATDPWGQTSELSPCKVVTVPPWVVAQPESATVLEGQPVTLTLEAAGAPPLHYQWLRNGVVVSGANSESFTLAAATLAHAGTYTVVITNQDGMVVSAPALLTVLTPTLPVLVAQPQNQAVSAGTSVILSVGFSGVGPIAVQWRLNGVNIEGATNAVLVLDNVQATNAGTYSAVVSSSVGAVNSAEAVLTVLVPTLGFKDTFASLTSVSTATGVGRASNVLATAQVGEPVHAGKPGGRTVWIEWKAPANGIVTFSTLGSGFDTLLAVYTGTTLSNLVEVASDDDSGGFLSSTVSFNAVKDTRYKIAVDGFGGAGGELVLSWRLESTADRLPVIIAHPNSQTVTEGGTVIFTVGASGTGLNYQWFFQRDPIPGATNSDLTLPGVTRAQVGGYWVRVSNSARSVRSRRALLELAAADTDVARGKSKDKFRDAVLEPDRRELGAPVVEQFRRLSGSGTVSRGYTGMQIFSTAGSTKEPGEPNHCGIPGGASSWFVLTTTTNGTLLIDTFGSSFDTVLAVYTGPGTDFASLVPVACNNNSGPGSLTSKVQIPAGAGVNYFIAVDGVGAASGTVQLNYVLGDPPIILTNPVSAQVAQGATATLSVSAKATPKARYQWHRQGTLLLGATNANLVLANFQPAQAGQYSVSVSNVLGAVASEAAQLQLAGALRLSQAGQPGQTGFALTIHGSAGQTYVIEASTNLTLWQPVATNAPPTGVWEFRDPSITNRAQCYFRAFPLTP